jgi:hypothetical protein
MRATRGVVGARREPVLPAGLSARIFSGFPQGPGSAATCRLHVALIASDSRRWLSSSLAFVASTVAVVRRGHSCVTFALEAGALHAGALHAGSASCCVPEPNVSGPDAPARWTCSSCWQPSLTGHDPPSPVSSASRRVHAGLCCPPRNPCSPTRSPGALHAGAPLAEAPQLWLWSRRLGPGCSGPGPAVHVGSPARLRRSWAAIPPFPSTSHCVLAVLGPPAAAAPWSSTRWRSPRRWRLQPWSRSRRLRPGCSGPRPAPHVGSPARLVTARQALSPPRSAVCTRALCGPPRRPGALHTGAPHAGGAPSCGLGAGVTGVPLAQELSRGGCARRGGPWAPGVSPFCPQGCPRVSSPASRKGPGLLQLAGFTWHSLHLTVGAGFHRRWLLSLLLWPLYGAGILALRLSWRP